MVKEADTCPEFCVVPGCTAEAEYSVPDYWCEEHWTVWFDWPPDKDDSAPEWIKQVARLGSERNAEQQTK